MKNSNVNAVLKVFNVAVKSQRVFAKEKSERLLYTKKELSMIECLKCSRWEFYCKRNKKIQCDQCQKQSHRCLTFCFTFCHALIILIKLREINSILSETFFVRKKNASALSFKYLKKISWNCQISWWTSIWMTRTIIEHFYQFSKRNSFNCQ